MFYSDLLQIFGTFRRLGRCWVIRDAVSVPAKSKGVGRGWGQGSVMSSHTKLREPSLHGPRCLPARWPRQNGRTGCFRKKTRMLVFYVNIFTLRMIVGIFLRRFCGNQKQIF